MASRGALLRRVLRRSLAADCCRAPAVAASCAPSPMSAPELEISASAARASASLLRAWPLRRSAALFSTAVMQHKQGPTFFHFLSAALEDKGCGPLTPPSPPPSLF